MKSPFEANPIQTNEGAFDGGGLDKSKELDRALSLEMIASYEKNKRKHLVLECEDLM